MTERSSFQPTRSAALLAIQLLFTMVWGFGGISKVLSGKPDWFADKFGKTLLATFPGLTASFWLLAAAELLAFALILASLARLEFLGRNPPRFLGWGLAWSLFVFVQLGFGQWLTAEFNATAQLFAYFAGTLVCLQFVMSGSTNTTPAEPGH
jgi:hypothetical protein